MKLNCEGKIKNRKCKKTVNVKLNFKDGNARFTMVLLKP